MFQNVRMPENMKSAVHRAGKPCTSAGNFDLLFSVKRNYSEVPAWKRVTSIIEEWRLLGYKTPVHTSQETHYVSATESSQLMLCKIWDFHDDDCEKCRLMRYKNPVRTSQEAHYVSTTELSRLMLCKIWGFHGSDCEGCRLLGCYAVWLL
jgi:hypothetical protein